MTDTENTPIGYIFPNAKVVGRNNYHNLWILKSNLKKNILLLKGSYISKGATIKPGNILENLVVIGYGKNNFHVAVDNYQQDLIYHFYCCSDNSYWLRRSIWRIWQKRLQKECGNDFKNNVTINKAAYKSDDLTLDIFWLKGSNYILPVFGYKGLDMLQGDPLFYPELFVEKYRIGRSVYKTDCFNNLPHKYAAKITGESLCGDISKSIRIFFHGFTYPAKWHYGIWKHVLAFTREARESEKILWEKLWNKSFSISKGLFKYCKAAENVEYKEITCDENTCLSLSLFKNIHTEINNLCQQYLKQFVTSFESNTTNSIVLFNGPFNSAKIVLKYTKQWAEIHQKTVLYGICYNWDDAEPVFHVNPVTMYLDDKIEKDWLKKKDKDNESAENSRIIFDGYISEIKQCS